MKYHPNIYYRTIKSTGASVDNVKSLNKLRVNKSTVGACFVAGTLISTEEGLRPIEEINIGDYVWAENLDTNEKELKRVVNTFIHTKDEIVHLHANGEEIETTREHPFYVEGKGFVKAEYLETGDELRLQSGAKVVLEGIWYEELDEPIYVYNFEVEDFHTYYVGESSVLVHNKAMVRKGAKITRKSKGGSQAKTGPKPAGTGPHNKKIAETSEMVSDGKVIAGGGQYPECVIQTPGGVKNARRPDIIVEKPDGSMYGINVGKTTAKGAPIKREVQALYDLGDAGIPMYYVSYDR